MRNHISVHILQQKYTASNSGLIVVFLAKTFTSYNLRRENRQDANFVSILEC